MKNATEAPLSSVNRRVLTAFENGGAGTVPHPTYSTLTLEKPAGFVLAGLGVLAVSVTIRSKLRRLRPWAWLPTLAFPETHFMPTKLILFLAPTLLRALALSLIIPHAPRAEEFRILAWNVESNRPGSPQVSDPGVVSQELRDLLRAPATRAQIVALSEVAPETVPAFRQAVAEGLDNARVDFVTSASGGFRDADSLLLVVDASRFQIEEVLELHRYAGIAANFNVMDHDSPDYGTVRARSPLIARLRDQTTGESFWLVVVHLARGENELRADQARVLRRWAEDHAGESIIAAGDFNFDYDFNTQRGNSGFDAMVENGVWQWLKPDPLVDSNWADDRDSPGHDRYPDSILDFVFVAHRAKEWRGESVVIVRAGDFPDSNQTSDHRPVITRFEPHAP